MNEPKDFNNELVRRVSAGTAYVINNVEYANLPASLKMRYYPLFRRSDTTYRLHQEYMSARQDVDPNVLSPTIVSPRPVTNIRMQPSGDKYIERQPAGAATVSTNPSTTDTEIQKKGLSQIAFETQRALYNRPKINVTYSKY